MISLYARKLSTVIFQKAWNNVFQELSDEDAGILIKALFSYMDGNNVTLNDKSLNSVFRLIAEQIDVSAEKYLQRVGII